ncbi:MAG: hypothetical protein A2142_02120 [candidate division Zixibacteria bacterium RBG_16_48_11]|nr:MAG: hypothetical protein A2142_02120 [candidate division Zixibacteria bacterium RBG_16_48_11]
MRTEIGVAARPHQADGFSYLTFQPLENKELIHLFVNKPENSRKPNQAADSNVIPTILRSLDFPSRTLVSLKQVHKNRAVVLESKGETKLLHNPLEGDALFTNRKDLYLTIRVADCLPLYVYDSRSNVIGLIHAGWRGAFLGIVKNALETAKLVLDLDPSVCLFLLGPCIQSCCYQIPAELAILFPSETVQKRDGKYYLDLCELNKTQLLEKGAKPQNIYFVKDCTFCNPDIYYSYRRTGNKIERMYAVFGLR